MEIGKAWRAVRDRFRTADLDTPEIDAKLLAEAAFGRDAMGLLAAEKVEAPERQLVAFESFADRRLDGEPVARILGHKWFYGLDFQLNDATLVPRPETELVVDRALEAIKGLPAPRILDLGTGSGCIAIAILAHAPKAAAVAVDLSPAAIEAARANAAAAGVSDRIAFRVGSWCTPLLPDEMFDAIVANPPYVETDIIDQLAPEVAEHDPRLALDGGEDGLMAYRAIAAQVRTRVHPNGAVIIEIGS